MGTLAQAACFFFQHEVLRSVFAAPALAAWTTLGYSSLCVFGVGTRGLWVAMATMHPSGASSFNGNSDGPMFIAMVATVFASAPA